MRMLQRRCIYCRENGPRVMTCNGARWGSVRLRYLTVHCARWLNVCGAAPFDVSSLSYKTEILLFSA